MYDIQPFSINSAIVRWVETVYRYNYSFLCKNKVQSRTNPSLQQHCATWKRETEVVLRMPPRVFDQMTLHIRGRSKAGHSQADGSPSSIFQSIQPLNSDRKPNFSELPADLAIVRFSSCFSARAQYINNRQETMASIYLGKQGLAVPCGLCMPDEYQ